MDVELTQEEQYSVLAVLAAARDKLDEEREDSGVAKQLRSGIELLEYVFGLDA